MKRKAIAAATKILSKNRFDAFTIFNFNAFVIFNINVFKIFNTFTLQETSKKSLEILFLNTCM